MTFLAVFIEQAVCMSKARYEANCEAVATDRSWLDQDIRDRLLPVIVHVYVSLVCN
jgi:hypothetical protein